MDSVNDLLERLKSGKDDAFEELYALLAPKMLGVCYRYAKDVAEAEDLLHEGFILVYRKIDTFSSTGSGEGWIRRVMVNNALNFIKKNHALKFSEELNHEVENNNTTINDAISVLAYEEIVEHVNALSDGYRMVFNLFAIEGYTHKEIAQILGITESTSKTQYRMARKRLMERLSEVIEKERRSIG